MIQTGGGTISSQHHGSEPRGNAQFILIYLVLAAGIIAAAVSYHNGYAQHFRAGVERQLSGIATLKISEIELYRKERLGNAEILFKNPAFSALASRLFEHPEDAVSRRQLQSWLAKYPDHFDYAGVFLLDQKGVTRMSSPAVSLPYQTGNPKLVAAVLAKGEVVFQDFFRNEQDQRIYCSVLVPIIDEMAAGRPRGVVVLLIDPLVFLYPLINRWPTPSRTAETLLVRRDGGDALFLNELRFRKGTALSLRIPLARDDIAAVKAILGQNGAVESLDYRGVPVIAHVAPVANSPWFLVARMDQAEVFAPLRERMRQMVGFVVVLLFGAGGGLGFIWRQRSVRFYQERTAAAEALREISAHQEVLLSAIPDIVMEVDNNKTYSWANQPGLEFFGEDVVGKDAASYFEGEQETYRTVQPLFDGNNQLIYVESWQRRRDGQKRLLAWSCRALKRADGRVTGALSSARDITEHRQAELELSVRSRIADIFLTASDTQMYDDVLSVILEVTESPLGMFGRLDEAGELVIPTASAGDPDANSGWPQAIREKKPNYSNASRAPMPADQVALKRQICVPLVLRGEVVGLFQVANRDKDYAEADLRLLQMIADYVAPVLHARLQRERHEADLLERNDELMRFTYTVSHDLKSPLVTVTTFLGYLEKDIKTQTEEAVAKDFEFIRNATFKMSRLLDELLELSRVGRKTNPSAEATLQAVVSDALELVAGRLAARGVKVKVTEEPFLLFGDRQRLVEIFQNLLDNAVKFSGEQPMPSVEVGAESTHEGTVFFVRDNGIGIDPRHMGKLFGLFEKLDPHTEGSGMGLALVRRIVQVHGGKIWVESDGPGCGSTFRFTLAKTRRAARVEKES